MKSKSPNRNINLDVIMEEIGEMGEYQIAHYILFSVIVILTSSSYLSYIFTAGQIDYRCQIPECEHLVDMSVNQNNSYIPSWLSMAVPFNADNTPAKCKRYARVSNIENNNCDWSLFNKSEEIRCTEFVYSSDEVTIVNAFNITCEENEWKLAVIGTLGYIAELLILPVCAVLSDKYGRRPILICTLLLSGICGIIKSFSSTYTMFAIMEFVTALVSGGTYMTVFVMAIEFAGPKKRVFSGTLISAMYSSSQVVAGVIAMLFHNFRDFLLALFVPNFLVLSFIWLVPESVRWLLTEGKIQQARKILLQASKRNQVTLSDHTIEALSDTIQFREIEGGNCVIPGQNRSEYCNVKVRRKNPLFMVLQSKSLILRLLNCLFCWFTNSFIYYGMNVNSVALAGNKYVNYILVNLVEVPAVFLASYLMETFGRKRVLFTFLLINGIACVATELTDGVIGRLVLYIIGKIGVTISFTVLYVFSSELFPTEMRHSFMNACSTVGSLGSIIAPLSPLLVHTWSALPLLMFGGSALTAALMVLLLPETLHTKLPDTVEEAEDIGHMESMIADNNI